LDGTGAERLLIAVSHRLSDSDKHTRRVGAPNYAASEIYPNDCCPQGAISCHMPRIFRLEGPPAARDSPSPMASRGNRENLRPAPAFFRITLRKLGLAPLRVFKRDASRHGTVACSQLKSRLMGYLRVRGMAVGKPMTGNTKAVSGTSTDRFFLFKALQLLLHIASRNFGKNNAECS